MKVIELNTENFEKEVLESDKPVLVDFNADWCGPCQMMRPIIEEFAEEYKEYKVASLNIDGAESLAEKYEVSGIPCLIVFKNGEEVARTIGVQSKRKLKKLMEA